ENALGAPCLSSAAALETAGTRRASTATLVAFPTTSACSASVVTSLGLTPQAFSVSVRIGDISSSWGLPVCPPCSGRGAISAVLRSGDGAGGRIRGGRPGALLAHRADHRGDDVPVEVLVVVPTPLHRGVAVLALVHGAEVAAVLSELDLEPHRDQLSPLDRKSVV